MGALAGPLVAAGRSGQYGTIEQSSARRNRRFRANADAVSGGGRRSGPDGCKGAVVGPSRVGQARCRVGPRVSRDARHSDAGVGATRSAHQAVDWEKGTAAAPTSGSEFIVRAWELMVHSRSRIPVV